MDYNEKGIDILVLERCYVEVVNLGLDLEFKENTA
jgi:hypothetical protein